MKQDTLLQNKEVTITYEENIEVEDDYLKLLEPF
jgi:hypothetical protein